uniref:Transmembrane 9 superfamily member n=1 Tax=Amazona collaria TaxID=241587 RepID=A0A8B9FCM1_9PSIT
TTDNLCAAAALLPLLLLCLPLRARADEHEHTYQDKEEVVLWMNTVGPYHNRQETYKYFSLPFCIQYLPSLQGVELEFSGLDIKFKEDVIQTTYCEIDLDKGRRDAFVYAIKNHYWCQMYIDDLPIWGIVGEADENGEDCYLWTYKKLEIGYNGNRIVDVNLTSEGKVKLVPNTKIQMSYSVKWKKSDVKFEDRFDKYLGPSFFQHRIHWFSIFNSFMMVIFLVGLVSMILMRTLRKDYARYSKEEEMNDMDRDLGDEYGSEVADMIELANRAAQRETQKEGAAFVAAALKEAVSPFLKRPVTEKSKRCYNCGKGGHFQAQCRTRKQKWCKNSNSNSHGTEECRRSGNWKPSANAPRATTEFQGSWVNRNQGDALTPSAPPLQEVLEWTWKQQ